MKPSVVKTGSHNYRPMSPKICSQAASWLEAVARSRLKGRAWGPVRAVSI